MYHFILTRRNCLAVKCLVDVYLYPSLANRSYHRRAKDNGGGSASINFLEKLMNDTPVTL